MSGRSEKEQFWRLVLEEHAQSGLPAREFCRREAVSEPSFYAWRRKIRERDAQSRSDTEARSNVEARSGCRLVPVTVVESVTNSRLSSVDANSRLSSVESRAERNSRLEIVTAGGGRVRVDESCTVELIRRALVAMRLADGEGVSC